MKTSTKRSPACPLTCWSASHPGLPLSKTAGDVQKKTIWTMYEMIQKETPVNIAEDLLAIARKGEEGSERAGPLGFNPG